MAIPNTWEYVVPQLADDEAQHPRAERVRVVTYLRRGLFADAMHSIMEQERFEVVGAHGGDSVLELARTADGCIIDMSVADARDTLLAVSEQCRDLRLVVLADADTTHAARAATRTAARAHVTSGESLDRVLAILRGEDIRFERRTRSERAHANGDCSARDPRQLTARESEILEGLLDGENTKVLAARLGVSQATARTHVQSVLSKLGVHSRLEAVALVNAGTRGSGNGVRNGRAPRR
jgi:two-component system, NarL family, nitrate/nitrite response regulator NarL